MSGHHWAIEIAIACIQHLTIPRSNPQCPVDVVIKSALDMAQVGKAHFENTSSRLQTSQHQLYHENLGFETGAAVRNEYHRFLSRFSTSASTIFLCLDDTLVCLQLGSSSWSIGSMLLCRMHRIGHALIWASSQEQKLPFSACSPHSCKRDWSILRPLISQNEDSRLREKKNAVFESYLMNLEYHLIS